MLGAIIGDIIGSTYEFDGVKTKDFELFPEGSTFTDDTVLTVATADAILNNKTYEEVYREYPKNFPQRGYGDRFSDWTKNRRVGPYNSFGNGSAMRVGPIGWAFGTLEEVLEEAKKSAEVTHNHPEGIKGAQAVASAVFLARQGKSKKEIKEYIEETFGYNVSQSVDEIREDAVFDETCMVSVPQAIICFLDSSSFEDAVRNAVSLGGDADTQACIAGGIAEAYYKEIPQVVRDEAIGKLDPRLKEVVEEFCVKYGIINTLNH